jgi:hypothetical protein
MSSAWYSSSVWAPGVEGEARGGRGTGGDEGGQGAPRAPHINLILAWRTAGAHGRRRVLAPHPLSCLTPFEDSTGCCGAAQKAEDHVMQAMRSGGARNQCGRRGDGTDGQEPAGRVERRQQSGASRPSAPLRHAPPPGCPLRPALHRMISRASRAACSLPCAARLAGVSSRPPNTRTHSTKAAQ